MINAPIIPRHLPVMAVALCAGFLIVLNHGKRIR